MDKKNGAIKSEISRFFLIIAVVISLIISGVFFSTFRDLMIKHFIDELQAIAHLKVNAIQGKLKNVVAIAESLVNEVSVRENIIKISLLDNKSELDNNEKYNNLKKNLDINIGTGINSAKDLAWLDIYDLNFNLIFSAGDNKNKNAYSIFSLREIYNTKKPKVGNFYVVNGIKYNNLFIPISHPQNNHEIIGFAVFGRECICEVSEYLKYTAFGESGEFLVTQKQGDDFVIVNAVRNGNNPPLSIKYPSSSEKSYLLRQAFNGLGGTIIANDYRDKEVVSSYHHLPEYNLSVIAKIDMSEIFERFKWVFIRLIAITIITIVIAYIIISRRLEKALSPVQELEHGARRFSHGDLNYRIPIYGNNELSRLTRAFNNMAERLDAVTSSKSDLDNQIEKQKEIERKLHDERAKLEAIFESNKDSIVVWDTDYRHLYVNGAACAQVGISKRNMLGKTISEVFEDSPEIAHFWMQKAEKVFSDGEVLESQDKTNYKDRVIYGESIISPILNEHDEIIAVGMVFRDITQRKLAEEAAAASWSMLHQIIDNVPVSVFWKDTESKFLGANMNLAKWLGFDSPEEIIGKTDFDLTSKDFAEEIRKDDREVIENKQSKLNYEERFEYKDGSKKVLNTSKVPLLRADGSVYGVLGCFVEVTERIEFIEKLQQAQRKADLANKSKTDFLASMSHEIRTPINAITGMADVLLQTGVSSSQSEYIKILKAAGENLSHLVGNILDYTKIESGELELHSSEFSLGDALNDSVNLVMLKTHEKNIYLNMNVDDEVQLKLYGDSGKLKQILLNLLNNAAKFTNTGGIDLKVSEWLHASPGKYMLLFEVVDTGPGIPEDKLGTIFDRFSQLDDGVHGSDSQYGAGLGLSICQELVSVLDGSIWVESELGKGCKFCFTASFKPMDELKVIRHQPSAKLSLRGTIAKVCCNDPDLSEQMIKNLEEWSIRAKHATGPQEECFDTECDFIILIADCEIIDGILTKYQKDQLAPVAHKVVIIPKNVEAEKLDRLKAIGLTTILNLPVVRKDLYECLDHIHTSKDGVSSKNSNKNNKFTWYDPARVRVLIADDDPITKKVMRLAFENMGYRVDIVSNGNEVLTSLEYNTYDIIFMDTDMPEMDGNETTRLIREQEQDSDRRVPIVSVTAKVFDGDRKIAFDSGVDWFLPKPVIVEQMVEAINKLVKF